MGKTKELSVKRVAEMLGVTPSRVVTYCREGRFKGAYKYPLRRILISYSFLNNRLCSVKDHVPLVVVSIRVMKPCR